MEIDVTEVRAGLCPEDSCPEVKQIDFLIPSRTRGGSLPWHFHPGGQTSAPGL